MDFEKAVKARIRERRHKLIKEQIYDGAWADWLEEETVYGGTIDDVQVTEIEIADDEGSEYIQVRLGMEFDEVVASFCKDLPHRYGGKAEYVVTIHRESGDHEVGDSCVSIDFCGGSDVY